LKEAESARDEKRGVYINGICERCVRAAAAAEAFEKIRKAKKSREFNS
jgi:hypothetical protein